MRLRFLSITALALIASAAPTSPSITTHTHSQGATIEILSNYFNLLSRKVAAYKYEHHPATTAAASTCDLSTVQLPSGASTALSAPSQGLVLAHVALGRGTQNYTCTTADSSVPPVLAGAVATLFNASCVAAAYPDLLEALPSVALQLDDHTLDTIPAPAELALSGYHFFNAAGSPVFELTAGPTSLGDATCAKLNATPAPAGATPGRGGEVAIPWLKLNATSEGGRLREVYRLTTAGGSAPATCEGMPDRFTVQYTALYWFYGEA